MTVPIWLIILFVVILVYLVVGYFVSVMLYYTPYRDNGKIMITLLWPVFLLGMFRGLKNRPRYPID